eukprot:11217060-Lingulodinium_polyedra.AAC.1
MLRHAREHQGYQRRPSVGSTNLRGPSVGQGEGGREDVWPAPDCARLVELAPGHAHTSSASGGNIIGANTSGRCSVAGVR